MSFGSQLHWRRSQSRWWLARRLRALSAFGVAWTVLQSCSVANFSTPPLQRHRVTLRRAEAAASEVKPSSGARWVKPVYVMSSVAALWSSRRSWLDSLARCATVLVALVDFAPTAASQMAASAAAWEINPNCKRWVLLVRLKVVGELCGLFLLCNGRYPACLGASVAILSHVLFWLGGAASTRVDASGKPAPVPAPVARTILGADVAVLTAAVAGWSAPGAWGVAGAAAYTGAVTLVSCEKFMGRSKGQQAGKTARKAEAVDAVTARDWKHFAWRNNWYPIAFADVTDKARPHRVELFGDGLVLWWDTGASAWRVAVDRCPHRLAPLSEGRVDNFGHLECPYHGWTFDGQDGACHKVPQAADMGDDSWRSRCSAQVFHTSQRQGLIWVWGSPGANIEDVDESQIPVCDALESSEFEWIDVSRDMPYSADILLENLLDSSHVPFTHHKTVSKRENAQPLPLQITERVSASGFRGAFKKETPVGEQTWDAKGGRRTERSTVFKAPTYMHHRIRTSDSKGDLAKGFETWTVAYATPTGPGRSRLFARFPFRFPAPKFGPNLPRLVVRHLPDWLNHLGQLRVLDDDNIFLPIQERQVQDAGGWKTYVMPTSADTFVTAFRNWFDRAGPPPHAASAVDEYRYHRPTRAELLDRHAQHTAHCKSCTGAVRNCRKVVCLCRFLLMLAAGAAPALFARHVWRGLLLLLLTSCVVGKTWQVAWGIQARLTSGLHDYPPPRNQPGRRGQNRELRTVEQGRRF